MTHAKYSREGDWSTIVIPADAHRMLKMLSARTGKPMCRLIDHIIRAEFVLQSKPHASSVDEKNK